MTEPIIIGSRGSDLALWQARFFQSQLAEHSIASEIKIIKTKGDQIQHLSFDKMEGKGFFTKEIESALLNGDIDVAIHSHKDLETSEVEGLCIAGVSYREDPSELLLIHPDGMQPGNVLSLKQGAVVGTSSARRKSQLLAMRPDVKIKDIRGNVPTRIQKLRDGHFDAILLAAAGVKRLGLNPDDLHVKLLDPRIFVPAPAQGVLAYQCRVGDDRVKEIIQLLHDPAVSETVNIERGILKTFGGGCQIPLGVLATKEAEDYQIRVSVADAWNAPLKRYRFTAANASSATAQFMELSQKQPIARAFMSTDLANQSMLAGLCREHGIELTGESLIQIQHTKFEVPDAIDWIFFSSRNAVRAFFQQQDFASIGGVKLAAYGEATARALFDYLDHIDFIAEPGQPEEVAEQLDREAAAQRIFFPTSAQSLGTIPKALQRAEAVVATAYSSEPKVCSLSKDFDAYIFTSPSNVRSFFDAGNSIAGSARVIALGSSTANALNGMGINPTTADVPHALELFALLR